MLVNLIELANIFRKVAVEPRRGFRKGKVQVHSHLDFMSASSQCLGLAPLRNVTISSLLEYHLALAPSILALSPAWAAAIRSAARNVILQ
jgi:hypothetical protein